MVPVGRVVALVPDVPDVHAAVVRVVGGAPRGDPDEGLPGQYGRPGSSRPTIRGSCSCTSPSPRCGRPAAPPSRSPRPQTYSLLPFQSTSDGCAISRATLSRASATTCADRLLLGVGRAGEREVLPDQHAQLVAQVVEVVGLEDAAAPDPQQVDVGALGLVDPLSVPLAGHPRREAVVRDPVRAPDQDRLAVDPQAEGGCRTVVVGRGVELDGPEADAPLPSGRARRVVVARSISSVVGGCSPRRVRPPGFDAGDVEAGLGRSRWRARATIALTSRPLTFTVTAANRSSPVRCA